MPDTAINCYIYKGDHFIKDYNLIDKIKEFSKKLRKEQKHKS